MSATFTTFCSDAIADAAIQNSGGTKSSAKIMVLSILTDTGDYLSLHFKDKKNFQAFCARHNFNVEDKTNECKN